MLAPDRPNGSPIGFRVRVQVKDQAGLASPTTETTVYPVVDPASSFELRMINGYWPLTTAGKAYAVVRAEDGDGTVDERVEHQPGGAVGVADRYDENRPMPGDRELRSKVLTFYVNHAPALLRGRADFYPRAGTLLPRKVGPPDSPAFNLPATDDDWYDPLQRGPIGGTPTKYGAILRWKLAISGTLAGTMRDTCYLEGLEFSRPSGISFTIPDWIAAGAITVRIRLCDCNECDVLSGYKGCPFVGREGHPAEGTCVDTEIPCQLAGPTVARAPDQRGP